MRNKKSIIISILGGIFLIVISLGVVYQFHDRDGTENQEAPVIKNEVGEKNEATTVNSDGNSDNKDENGDIGVTEETDETTHNQNISLFIAEYHQILNEITTYNRHEFIDWDNMNSVREEMSYHINKLLEQKKSFPSSMQIDLERMLLLADIGTESQDSTAIIYIHRILHDLDVEYNNYKPNNKFGFSNYDSGGENQMVLSNYIKENGLSEDTY
ncbi:hypothetical protein GGQ92_000630 [Gracilibacillus halotolerans]|uniref:Uncharacterized protein n=1 Tax=Gracilibacillus halotolerans TaxID=74386 RepID=A0A841RJP8_9BACI|nr:hypothetical protein [Gracilibacillus halotolerans]MBB6511863.1 hypothetical protein [Gracilibacillus halotolerans]